jgi:cell division protein ZapA
MSDASKSLDISIMGREFRVACSEEEKQGLLAAVEYLDKKMCEIRDSGKVIGAERVAIMAALNIAHEFLTAKVPAGFDIVEVRRRMTRMHAAIDEVISDQEPLF